MLLHQIRLSHFFSNLDINFPVFQKLYEKATDYNFQDRISDGIKFYLEFPEK